MTCSCRKSFFAVVAAGVLLACGDGRSPAPRPPDGSTDGGHPTPPGGTPGGGGATPPGDGGSGGGGLGSIASDDGTVVVTTRDAHEECSGLVPSRIPAPVRLDWQSIGGCGHAVSDGTGHVAIATNVGARSVVWDFFTPEGAPRNDVTTWWDGVSLRDALVPQAEGWLATTTPGGERDPYFILFRLASDGAVRAERGFVAIGLREWSIREDPLGGALLLFSGSYKALYGGMARVDTAGEDRSHHLNEFGPSLPAGAVSTRGEALVLDAGGEPARATVNWISPDGSWATEPSDDGRLVDTIGSTELPRLYPLLDGSIAARSGGAWVRRYSHLAPRGGPPPAWLVSRSGWTYRFTRGNRGYALSPPADVRAACDQTVELRAPSGRLCGTVTFTEPGGSCATGPIDQGWDGTVVQKSGRSPCGYRWWPRLLAAE